jgi:protein TonB
MTRASSLAAIAMTLLLHAGAIALVSAEFTSHRHAAEQPVQVALQSVQLREQPAAAPAVTPPPPKPRIEPRIEPKPVPAPRSAAKPKPRLPAAVEVNPSEPPSTPAPVTAFALPAPMAAAPEPVKTSVAVNASYIATETEKWYPSLSKRYEEQGAVSLRVHVSPAGRAEKVELRKASGYPLLDEAAIGLARSLKYIPAKLDGNPVADWIDLPVVFKLRNP